MADDALKLLLLHRAELFGFVRALVRDSHAAEDLFQEVAIVIVRKAGEGIDVHNFRAWSKEIARLVVLRHFREQKSERTVPLLDEDMFALIDEVYDRHPVDPHEASDEAEALRDCLGEMPERSRNLIRLRHVAGRSYAEIATMVAQTEGAIRRAVARARIALLDCVQKKMRKVAS